MQVDGFLDEKKAYMLSELDKYLAFTPEQKKIYSLIRRSSFMHYPLDIVNNEEVIKKVLPEIERLERGDAEGFNRHIATLMSYTIPQPQTDDEWN